MRLGPAFGLAALLIGSVLAVLLLWTPSRRAGQDLGDFTAAGTLAAEVELLKPDELPGSSSATAESAPRRRERGEANSGRGGPLQAVVRGRVVVLETGDPIEAVLDLRLRTLDLRASESLVTNSDGTFTSHRAFRSGVLLALVQSPEGRELVDHEAPFDPASPEEWLVPVSNNQWPTLASGRVVDRLGRPIEEAQVTLLELSKPRIPAFERGDSWGQSTLQDLMRAGEYKAFSRGLTDEGGRFTAGDLHAGRYRLDAHGHWARAASSEVVLRTGPNELGEIVVDEPVGAEVTVRLVLEQPELALEPVFEFEPAEGGPVRRFLSDPAEWNDDGSLTVRIPEIPARRYELRVRPHDGGVYQPEHLSVVPPATVEFHVKAGSARETIFRARHAGTGEAVMGFTVLARMGSVLEVNQARRLLEAGLGWVTQMGEVSVRPGFDEWFLTRAGFLPASGAFPPGGGTLEVSLEPGWGYLLRIEDANGDDFAPRNVLGLQDPPGLADVEVLADGRSVGVSDRRGFVLLKLEKEHARLEYRRPGWRVVSEFGSTVLMTQSP